MSKTILKPNVKLGDKVLRRKSNGGELDTWVECHVNETYLPLINEFPNDFKQLDGNQLEMLVGDAQPLIDEIAELVVQKLGEYVNGLGRRQLGIPLMDEVAVSQMKYIVSQIITDPSAEIEIPEYD
jgi:hypothetical protein